MYSEFDKISALGMPCSQLSVSEDSKPIQIALSLLKPMSEFPDKREIPSKHSHKESRKEEMNNIEQESNESIVPSSSSSCSSQEHEIQDHGIEKEASLGWKTNGEEREKEGAATSKEEDDDGYHTPTSPRNRIPTPTKCPPAPKKPTPCLRAKRKRESHRAHRHADVDHHVEFVLSSGLDDQSPNVKKAKGNSGIAD